MMTTTPEVFLDHSVYAHGSPPWPGEGDVHCTHVNFYCDLFPKKLTCDMWTFLEKGRIFHESDTMIHMWTLGLWGFMRTFMWTFYCIFRVLDFPQTFAIRFSGKQGLLIWNPQPKGNGGSLNNRAQTFAPTARAPFTSLRAIIERSTVSFWLRISD